MKLKTFTLTLLTAAMLAGCGGGSDDTKNNGVSREITQISASIDYRQSDGGIASYYDTYLKVNVPGKLPVRISGLPAGAKPRFSTSNRLPAGLTIDANSGVISGTATVVSRDIVVVSMTVDGFEGSISTQFAVYVQI